MLFMRAVFIIFLFQGGAPASQSAAQINSESHPLLTNQHSRSSEGNEADLHGEGERESDESVPPLIMMRDAPVSVVLIKLLL